jgi:hypothetical protein
MLDYVTTSLRHWTACSHVISSHELGELAYSCAAISPGTFPSISPKNMMNMQDFFCIVVEIHSLNFVIFKNAIIMFRKGKIERNCAYLMDEIWLLP